LAALVLVSDFNNYLGQLDRLAVLFYGVLENRCSNSSNLENSFWFCHGIPLIPYRLVITNQYDRKDDILFKLLADAEYTRPYEGA
jgi:hypothetical protein